MIGSSLRNVVLFLLLGAVAVLPACGAGGDGEPLSSQVGSGGDPDSPSSGEPLPGMATVSWTAPETNIDGSPIDDLAGFRIYFDHTPLSKSSPFTFVGNKTEFTVPNLEPGLYYFAVSAIDTGGEESDLSEMVTQQVS